MARKKNNNNKKKDAAGASQDADMGEESTTPQGDAPMVDASEESTPSTTGGDAKEATPPPATNTAAAATSSSGSSSSTTSTSNSNSSSGSSSSSSSSSSNSSSSNSNSSNSSSLTSKTSSGSGGAQEGAGVSAGAKGSSGSGSGEGKKDVEMTDASSSSGSGSGEAGKDASKADAAKVIGESGLTEEDLDLKKSLDSYVAVLSNAAAKEADVSEALRRLSSAIVTATSSMTSIPKPLKFLVPHIDNLVEVFEAMSPSANRTHLADLISVLMMTRHDGKRLCLNYKLKGTTVDITTWGSEYSRNLAGEIAEEYEARSKAGNSDLSDLMPMVNVILPHNMHHGAESDACDLLIEVEALPLLLDHVDTNNYQRVANYLLACSDYVGEPTNMVVLNLVYQIYMKMNVRALALRVALRINDPALISEAYLGASSASEKKQLSLMLGRQRAWVAEEDDDELLELMGNTKLSEFFQYMARDMDIMAPKTTEDVYKSHLETVSRAQPQQQNVDSARKNLASTFVNAFLNAGFGADTLVTPADSQWIYRNKDYGVMSAVASQGMIQMWDWDTGSSNVNKYLNSKEPFILAGGLIAVGLVNNGVRTEYNTASALLYEHATNSNDAVRCGMCMGIAIAYAGQCKEDCMKYLTPYMMDVDMSMEVVGNAALALGIVYAGSCNSEIAQVLAQILLDTDRPATFLDSHYIAFVALAIGLVFMGQQEEVDTVLLLLQAVPEKIKEMTLLTVEVCAYAGTGDVLRVQKMLSVASDHITGENARTLHQAVAILGISIVAMGESLGSEMALRSFNHILQFCEVEVRRAVPLAIALLRVSNTKDISVLDTLSKLSHDPDADVAMGAILGLGLVGAGTNNARLAATLRELASYYSKEANHLFVVRLAQGFLYMGKGTVTFSPFHSDGILMNTCGVAGLLSVLFACLDMKTTILNKAHYLLYYLGVAMSPKFLITVNEQMEYLPVDVRVGEAVDVVGQAGKPKTITGFQTSTTPVLLMQDQRAELVSSKYVPISPILEGVVILKLNPAWDEEDDQK